MLEITLVMFFTQTLNLKFCLVFSSFKLPQCKFQLYIFCMLPGHSNNIGKKKLLSTKLQNYYAHPMIYTAVTRGENQEPESPFTLWHQLSWNQYPDTHTCAIQYNAPQVSTSGITEVCNYVRAQCGRLRWDGGYYSGSGHRWPLKR